MNPNPTPIKEELDARRGRLQESGDDSSMTDKVLLQIGWAFVIILGFLVVVTSVAAFEMAKKVRRKEREAAEAERAFAAVYAEFKGTSHEEQILRRIDSEEKSQLELLRRTWTELREARALNELLDRFETAGDVTLADDADSLPKGNRFRRLNGEIQRVFPLRGEPVSNAEVLALMRKVLTRAGFPLSARRQQDPEFVPADLRALARSNDTPTHDNLLALQQFIRDDLMQERGRVGRLQLQLVARIMKSRNEKLLRQPLTVDRSAASSNTTLEDVLRDLQDTIHLLPESADQIRKAKRKRQSAKSLQAQLVTRGGQR